MPHVFLLTIFLAGEPFVGPFDLNDIATCRDTGRAIVEIVQKNLEPLLRGREVTWKCDEQGRAT